MSNQILINSRIYTFNPKQPIAQAAAIRDGRFFAVGSNEDVQALADKDSTIENMQGRTVIPALTDAHIHLLEYGFSLLRINCETSTRAECLQRVRDRAVQTEAGKWILGHGWNHNVWPEGIGNKQMLDDISSSHPMYLTHKSLHSGWANSKALELAGIRTDSPDPKDGQFQRDENGQLTGILLESAMRVVEKAIPRPDKPERMQALQQAQQSLFAMGITSVHDFDPWDCYTALQAIQDAGELKLRIVKGIPKEQLDEAIEAGLVSGQGDDHLSLGWLKLFSDGALGPQTAAMLEPFENSSSTGMLFLTGEDVFEIGKKALPNGISMAIHAIGDRANREVIDGYAQLVELGLTQKATLPLRIEHVQLIAPQDMQRMAVSGIIASMQPIHAPSDHLMADKYWGNHCQNAYAWRSVKDSGARLAFGSDAPVESPNPFWGMHAALTRQPIHTENTEKSWIQQQCISLEESLEAYISEPHSIAGKADRLGKIQPGFIADLIVLPEDIFDVRTSALADMLPDATMVDGKWVFRKE